MLIKIITLTVTIYLIQLIAWFLEKRLGEKKGAFISAFFQGMLSSTALTLSNAKKSQTHHSHYYYHVLLMSSFTAILASLTELFLIIWFNEPILAQKLFILFPIYLILILVIIYHRYHLREFKTQNNGDVEFPKILEAIKLAVLLGGFIFISSLLKGEVGDAGPRAVAFVGGLFETHGVALAQLTLYDQGMLNLREVYDNVLLAVIAGFISKMSITFFLVRNKYSMTLSLTYFSLAVVTALLWFYRIS